MEAKDPPARDAGVTLVEVMVAMGVTSVVMAMVTTAVVQMYRFTNRNEVLSNEMVQLQTTFQQLDRSVRYAYAISQPSTAATTSGGWYVEWTSITGTTQFCNQLRLNTTSGVMQQRRRPDGGSLSAWVTVASSLGATQPFTLQPASTSGYPHQRLIVDVTVGAPSTSSQAPRRSTFSFTALNSTLTTVSTGVCSDMGRP
ncbi:prepilin-type N-terminal cleavage/methylation domain-containing protein [Actinoplanes sp. LDG1-06]|uniref:Prepilin-type N-terminal cleavage/methylation domain-containing protein n=1 Tax=Paractinoplanes ovalisporus TaxID=2810368 RepID=A0ABS2AGH2_9ACTN|nr:prepilin-type N-terminal cleavage/methylation domain-containing protein [Actinoplanes ovalisporus]MBM2618924.1 prepilin-type N-terminal cleavage/methylation domain-containing protein [Actinoplanes ovalisporus]